MLILFILTFVLILVNLCAIIFLYGLIRARMVPYVKTLQPVYDVLLQDLQLADGVHFVELGCGDAETLAQVTKKFPKIQARGYEIAVWPYIRARMLRRRVGGKYEIVRRSFMRADLSDVDIYYGYLLPHFMSPVWKKICTECKPGTLLYAYAFPVKNLSSIRTLQPHDAKNPAKHFGKLYVYEV